VISNCGLRIADLERFKENCNQLRCSVRPLAESVEPEARRYNLGKKAFGIKLKKLGKAGGGMGCVKYAS